MQVQPLTDYIHGSQNFAARQCSVFQQCSVFDSCCTLAPSWPRFELRSRSVCAFSLKHAYLGGGSIQVLHQRLHVIWQVLISRAGAQGLGHLGCLGTLWGPISISITTTTSSAGSSSALHAGRGSVCCSCGALRLRSKEASTQRPTYIPLHLQTNSNSPAVT